METQTRTAFAEIGAQFSASGASTMGGLQASQQGARSQLYGQQEALYSGALEAAGKIGTELDAILATSATNRSMLDATYDTLLLQAESNKDGFMVALMGPKIDFSVLTPILEETMAMSVDLASLQRSIEESNFQLRAGIEGFDLSASTSFAQMTAAANASQEGADATRDAAGTQAQGAIPGAGISALGGVAGGAISALA